MQLKKIIVTIVIIFLFCKIFCKKKTKTPQSSRFGRMSNFNANVISTSDNATDNSINDGNVLIFYAPWCGYCKKSMTDFKNAVSRSNGKIQLINSDEEPELVTKYNVKGFPTIMKTTGETHTGDRDTESILEFADLN